MENKWVSRAAWNRVTRAGTYCCICIFVVIKKSIRGWEQWYSYGAYNLPFCHTVVFLNLALSSPQCRHFLFLNSSPSCSFGFHFHLSFVPHFQFSLSSTLFHIPSATLLLSFFSSYSSTSLTLSVSMFCPLYLYINTPSFLISLLPTLLSSHSSLPFYPVRLFLSSLSFIFPFLPTASLSSSPLHLTPKESHYPYLHP